MSEFRSCELDFVEELRLRRWARRNYVPADRRAGEWHPVVLDEMRAKDCETGTTFADRASVSLDRGRRIPAREPDETETIRLAAAPADKGAAAGGGTELSVNRSLCAMYVPLVPAQVNVLHHAHLIPAEPNLTRITEPAAVEWLP